MRLFRMVSISSAATATGVLLVGFAGPSAIGRVPTGAPAAARWVPDGNPRGPSARAVAPAPRADGAVADADASMGRVAAAAARATEGLASRAWPVATTSGQQAFPAGAGIRAGETIAPTTVRGGWINDVDCVPLAFKAAKGGYDVECSGASVDNGDFTGRTVSHFMAHMDSALRVSGQVEELFVGTYAGDHSHGGLHTKGTFTVDEKGALHAEVVIVGGTCDWAGSTGFITYDGYEANGGYIGHWERSSAPPAADPTCNPADRVPGF